MHLTAGAQKHKIGLPLGVSYALQFGGKLEALNNAANRSSRALNGKEVDQLTELCAFLHEDLANWRMIDLLLATQRPPTGTKTKSGFIYVEGHGEVSGGVKRDAYSACSESGKYSAVFTVEKRPRKLGGSVMWRVIIESVVLSKDLQSELNSI